MEAASIVVAFSDSLFLRETLAVLLEHECELRFVSPDAASLPESLSPDLALVATPGPTRLLHSLTSRWPTLPILAVEMPDARARPGLDAYPHVRRVALEPDAIRNAVRRELALPPHGALHDAAQRMSAVLRTELAYSFTALRSFSALPATSSGPDGAAIIGAVLREQSHVVDECVALLHSFRTRPRAVAMSAEFVTILCAQLGQPETLPAARSVRCECIIDASSAHAPGPVALAPLIATLLRAHVRRRSDAASVAVRGEAGAVELRYPLRPSAAPCSDSWPLLLTSYALQPCSWRVSTATEADLETVSLCPEA